MTTGISVQVQPTMLQWAIDNGDQSIKSLLDVFPKLTDWLNGQTKPTLKQLERFSRKTSIPFGYLLLKEPPHEEIPALQFRTVGNRDAKASRALIDTIQAMETRQEWMREYLIGNGQDASLSFVESISDKESIREVAHTVQKLLDFDNLPRTSKVSEYLKLLRRQISRRGVLVMQSGVVGNQNGRKLNVDEFRAFVLIDDIAPLIFLNHQDTITANVFSIIHEFIHVLVGTSEVLNESPNVQSSKQEERWINAVTAAVLMPEKAILREYRAGNSNISHLARHFHVSPAAMSIRLHELDLINQDLVDEQMTAAIEPPVKPSGGDYYRNQISRLDASYLYAVIDAQRSGEISTSEAVSLSSTSMKTFDEVANRFMESVAR